jgi:outer membrane protein assembly factor BamD
MWSAMPARRWLLVVLAAATALSGCRQGFRLSRYPTNEALYQAALTEFQKRKWTNAITAFEKLTNDLPARDTLLPRSYWYLAQAHTRQREHLLAAQSFSRLFESFPDDTLADDAAMEAGRSYRRLWRKPTLDPTYGETALATFNTLIGLYPQSEFGDAARAEILDLEQWFATKSYETGLYYLRRKAYDSAIIYLRTVVERWPHVPRTRDALLRLAEAFDAIRYREDYNEACARLRRDYPGDTEAERVCTAARPAADSSAARPAQP